jgi:hypothetical protein
MNVGAGLPLVDGKAGAEKAGRERVSFGNSNPFAVERSAFTVGGGKEFFIDGIVDDADENLIALREGDGDAEAGIAVSKICGSVERIDVPAKFGVVVFA